MIYWGYDTKHPYFDTISDNYYRPLLNKWTDSFQAENTVKFSNACLLEFDMVPANDNIKMDFVYGDGIHNIDSHNVRMLLSEIKNPIEDFNVNRTCHCLPTGDVPVILISGKHDHTDTTNLAVFPKRTFSSDSAVPIFRYTMQFDRRKNYSVNNDTFCYEVHPGYWNANAPYTEYMRDNYHSTYAENLSGIPTLTTPLTANAPVTPCDTYHIMIGVSHLLFATYDTTLRSCPRYYPGSPLISKHLSGVASWLSTTYTVGTGTLLFDNLRSEGLKDSCTDTVSAIPQLSAELQLSLSPNPFSDRVALIAQCGFLPQSLACIITDVLGRRHFMHTADVVALNNELATSVVDKLQPGIYYMQVIGTRNGRQKVFKMVKE